ncbi:MAG: carbohydrate-binding family 9-like protein [Candidatus Aminicenantales bacterium]
MTGPVRGAVPARPSYLVRSIAADFRPGNAAAPWAAVPPLRVGHYLWLNNGYRPTVEARLCWTPRFLYVRFRVEEKRVLVRYTKFQDPVYKDSCVEFFIDAFPELGRGYVNFETNAMGTLLAQFGPDRSHRASLWPEDLAEYEAAGPIRGPVEGEYGADSWTLEYRLALGLFRKLYGEDIRSGRKATANFYKCGDETEVPHYGAWSPVGTPSPDFHQPEFFGELVFG